jgi:hypothetical protein
MNIGFRVVMNQLIRGRARVAGSARRAADGGVSVDAVLLVLVLTLYLSVRLIGLTRFPIYFFCDEAVQTNLAGDLVRDGFRGSDHELWPTYFRNDRTYNLSTSVYLQVLPYIVWGKSAQVTRSTGAVFSLLAALGVGLALKLVFQAGRWYLGIVLLSLTPAWFLHSRTAFETAVYVSFYALFLLFYLLYRYRSANYIFATLICGALAFYSYSPGQFVMAVTVVLLAVSDLSYHWRNRRLAWRAALLAGLLFLPYLRFRLQNPFTPLDHLHLQASYWTEPIALTEKLHRYFSLYARALSPAYWFWPNDVDLARHVMKGYGHLPQWSFPFFVVGVGIAVRNFRSSAHRTVLIALLAAPTGCALVGIGVTRALAFVIPATILSTLGFDRALGWAEAALARVTRLAPRRQELLHWALSGVALVGLTFANVALPRDALANGPLWFRNYGLYQMQWGAFQVFDRVQADLRAHPGTRIVFSPSWSNNTDAVARFFLGDPLPVQMGNIDGYLNRHLPLDDRTEFVMTPEEYERAAASGKFQPFGANQVVQYPDGRPGFYFVRLKYVEQIDAILTEEREARRKLVRSTIEFEGRPAMVAHSMLDMGTAQSIFDGNWDSVARTLEANPFVVELELPAPRRVGGLMLKIGSMQTRATVLLFGAERGAPARREAFLRGAFERPIVSMHFAPVDGVKRLRLELFDPNTGEPAHVHLWDVRLLVD